MLMGAWMQLVNMLLTIRGKGDGSRRPKRFDDLAIGEEELSANMGLRLLFILEGTPPTDCTCDSSCLDPSRS